MRVGERVAQLRAANGESLREAANRTGVSHTTIARIEKGEVTGSFQHTLRQIAKGYGVALEFLLTGEEQPARRPVAIHPLVSEEAVAGLAPELLAAYLALIRKAAQARIQPRTLEMAVDLLILQQRKESVSVKAV